MTAKRLYETARVLVYDPVASNRNGTRASLFSLGYRNVETVPALDMLASRLQKEPPDLLLAEVAGAEGETCALIQAIRQGRLGDNPFVVVVVTTWRRDGSIIGEVLNSGADDLVARPISATALGERIRLLTERRKGFVVTSEYIGPDRRRNARAGGPGAESMETPNPLKLRTLDHIPEDEIARLIAESVQQGKEKLNLEKLRRDAVQLCVQWRMLEQRHPGARDFCEILPRVGRLVAEMKRRAAVAKQTAAQEWCDSVTQSVKTLTAMGERASPSESGPDYQPLLKLLGHASLTLGRMFAAEEVEPARLVELDRLVAVNRARSAAA
jgi:DNA-binding response OmpR family regulator